MPTTQKLTPLSTLISNIFLILILILILILHIIMTPRLYAAEPEPAPDYGTLLKMNREIVNQLANKTDRDAWPGVTLSHITPRGVLPELMDDKERDIAASVVYALHDALLERDFITDVSLDRQELFPLRVVVLPAFSEQGEDAGSDASNGNYRRAMRFINNQLVRHDFHVVNPFGFGAGADVFHQAMAQARKNSQKVCTALCKQFQVDYVYIVWLKTSVTELENARFQATAFLEGEGYNRVGKDIGRGLGKKMHWTADSRAGAMEVAEKEIGDLVGRTLAGPGRRKRSPVNGS